MKNYKKAPTLRKLTPVEKKEHKYIEPKNWNKLIKNNDVIVIDVRKSMELKELQM